MPFFTEKLPPKNAPISFPIFLSSLLPLKPIPMDGIELLFLGTGTSAGVPMIGCHCEVCASSNPHDHRTRPSVLISYGDTRVLVDTTPELRLQCVANNVDMIDARSSSPMATPIMSWAWTMSAASTPCAAARWISGRMMQPTSPSAAPSPTRLRNCGRIPRSSARTWSARTINGPFQIGSQAWTPINLFHDGDILPILGFRVGKVAYCTDVSRIPEQSFELLKDLDVLVLDALGRQRHASHFSLEQAMEAAARIGARQTWFTHIAHSLPHAATNLSLPPNMQLAYDGQRVMAGI